MCPYRLPFWKLLANVDSGQKVERELRTFSNRLKRHQLGEGVISLNEHSTTLLSDMVRAPRRILHRAVTFKSPVAASSADRRRVLKICFGGTNLEKRDRSLMLDGSRAKRWQSCSSKPRKEFSLAQRFKLRSVPSLIQITRSETASKINQRAKTMKKSTKVTSQIFEQMRNKIKK